jgi:hypothetical protein
MAKDPTFNFRKSGFKDLIRQKCKTNDSRHRTASFSARKQRTHMARQCDQYKLLCLNNLFSHNNHEFEFRVHYYEVYIMGSS